MELNVILDCLTYFKMDGKVEENAQLEGIDQFEENVDHEENVQLEETLNLSQY